MPKIVQPSVVDIEIRRRLEEGMLRVDHRDIRGDDEQYKALLGLCRMVDMDPLIYTYEEIKPAIEIMFNNWRNRAIAHRRRPIL